ncbi:ATP-dependent helicase HrpB [Tessaracoccus sp. OH4464_COT-324]|uniref:ATP-dependent helicase HrpB n=1 Tax=Tessaracoccus sp. OH4464_COT-324 TaxID=2491059 RepID=UPI000F644379|nr:ATP-dependent helicase HrpB [Tessaracoccus sp. OH4464_COT-324]RRD44737.1 ATP-dependent helicase HrpB [Tessaracoccus sp. OH4464_COT-324]
MAAHPPFAELASLPAVTNLPVLAHLGPLAPGRWVICAPPGTGKTTAVPPAIAQLVPGRVVVTEPRRIAARAAARRLAALTGTQAGDYAGHTVRGDSTATATTRVEFVTTGVLLRRLLRDPELAGVDAVILDEVHERHLESDLTLAMLAELAEVREDLTIVAMSATLDEQRWAELLGGARIIRVPDQLHPLTIEWAPAGRPATDGSRVTDAFLSHVIDTTRDAYHRHPGSALVFLPGRREVEHVTEALVAAGLPASALHGGLDARAQDRALAEGARRIVVATSVAESSLTVPGVRIVVDSGLSREPRYDQARGVSGLVTLRESKAAATQRAGRAARVAPGVAVRCLAADDWPGMANEATPEAAVADLTDALLALACWGNPRGEGLRLPSPLPEPSVRRAEAELRSLGLLDSTGRSTALGRRVARLPLSPRLGVALLAGARRFGAQAAGEVVALLAEDPAGDLHAALAARRGERSWRAEAGRLARLAGGDSAGGPADRAAVAFIVGSARPGWLARARGSEYLTASGTGVQLPRGSRLGGDWLAVWDTQRVGERTYVRAGVEIDEAMALDVLPPSERVEVSLTDRVRARRVRSLGAIELGATPVAPTQDAGEATVREALALRGLGVLSWAGAAEALRRRLGLLHRVLGQDWPDVSDDALLARIDEWFGPELAELATGRPLADVDVRQAVARLVPWQETRRFDELAPERVRVPSGSLIRLDYPADGTDVVLAVKLQECFGLSVTPTICDGRVPLLMHLLSPAGRPLAVTRDLASFWANAYAQVRAENRGRYAKHPWPQDPLSAPAMRGTKRSGR